MIHSQTREDDRVSEFSFRKSFKQFFLIILIAVGCLLTLPMIGSLNFDKVTDITNNSVVNAVSSGKSDSCKNCHADNSDTKKQHKSNTIPFHRADTTPEKTVKLPFLKNYRNPCWQEISQDSNKTRIRCIPYFYLVGAPKCGTTDIFNRLKKHPMISRNNIKENHWLARKRFFGAHRRNLSSYLEYFEDAVKTDISKIIVNNYHPMIFGDGSASMLWDNRKLLHSHKDEQMKLPPFTNADIIKKLNPNAKILIMLRNPVTRIYSEYLFFKEDASKEEFHEKVLSALYYIRDCLRRFTVHYCTYFTGVRGIQIGFYHIYIEDYFRVFPRDQVKIIKLEDYSQHRDETLNDVYTFLGLNNPSKEHTKQKMNDRKANARDNRKKDKLVGDMFPKTRRLLADFYKPWNEKLVELLGEDYRYS